MSKLKINITSAEYAARLISSFYNNLGREFSIHPSHVNPKGKHINLIDAKTGQIFHIKFATEQFHKFGEFFPEYSGEEGESVDRSVVDKELRNNDIIFFCQPEIIRKCLVEDLKKFAFIRENDADDGIETYSIALSRLDIFF